MESYKLEVNDASLKSIGGRQRIVTPEGHVIPIQIRGALPVIDLHPPNDDEWENLPHVIMTSDDDWDPHIADSVLTVEEWFEATMKLDGKVPSTNDYGDQRFDLQGYYRQREVNNSNLVFFDAYQESPELDDIIDHVENQYRVNIHTVTPKDPAFEMLRSKFIWAPVDVIKKTFDTTTRWARSTDNWAFRKHFKSRFPALNVHRRHEPVATDTVYSDTPAIDNGAKSAQFFVGTKSLVCDLYGMKSDKEFIHTLAGRHHPT